MNISYAVGSSYYWSYIFLLHSSPGEFDFYSLPVMSLRGERWVGLMLKSAEAITLTPIKSNDLDLDTLLLSPLVLLFPGAPGCWQICVVQGWESFNAGTLHSRKSHIIVT